MTINLSESFSNKKQNVSQHQHQHQHQHHPNSNSPLLDDDDDDNNNNNDTTTSSFSDGYNPWGSSGGGGLVMMAFQEGIIHIIIYMSIGIIGYSFLLNTKWSIIDSMYFSTVIFTTVGYGDITPDDSASGMLFTIFYAFYGIIIIGIFLGILGDFAIERQQNLEKETLKRTRKNYLHNIMKADHRRSQQQSDDLIIVTAAGSADNIDDDDDDESLLNEEKNVTILTDICTICREQFRYMIVLIIIAIPITILERWSVTKGLYWMIISATTIGLGDEHPEQPWSRLICIIYIPLLVAFCGSLLGKIATSYVDKRNDILESQFFNRAVTESDLKSMDLDHSGKVSKDEFLIYMLLTLQKVDKTDIEDIMDLFKKLDKDGSGTLAVNDIALISNQTAKLRGKSVSLQQKYSSTRKILSLR